MKQKFRSGQTMIRLISCVCVSVFRFPLFQRNLPVCVLMCRFKRLGRSNALPHTSHGSRARSPRVGRALGDARGMVIDVSIRSPALLAADDDVDDSPDTDLCSSSPADGGDIGSKTRDSNDIDRSNGDSVCAIVKRKTKTTLY